MKKTFLIFSLSLVIVALGSFPMGALGLSTPSPQTPPFNPEGTPTGRETNVPPSSATTGCQSNSLGGALSTTLGGLANQLLPNGFGACLVSKAKDNQAQCNVSASGALTQLLGKNGGQAGQLVSSLLNSTSLGGQLNSSVNKAINNLFGGAGKGGLDIGGAAGMAGLVGGALGTSAIPVSDAQVQDTTANIKDIAATTQGIVYGIQSDQDTQLKVTCVQNILVKIAGHEFAVKFAGNVLNFANTGNGGWSLFGNPSDNGAIQTVVTNDFIKNQLPALLGKSPYLPTVQRTLATSYQNSTDPRTQFACPVKGIDLLACQKKFTACGTDYPTQIKNWSTIQMNPQCTAAGTARLAQALLADSVTARQNQQNQLIQQAGGILPKTKCIYPAGDNIPIQKCIVYKVLTPASTVAATINQAATINTDQQANAKTIGDLLSSLAADLGQKALTSFGGLLSFSQKDPNGAGTPLDQAIGATIGNTVSTQTQLLQKDIEASIGMEISYEAVLSSEIKYLEDQKIILGSLGACYAKSTLDTIASTTPSALGSQASSTVSDIVDPLLEGRNTEIANSFNVLSQLNAYDTQVQGVQSADALSALSAAYQALADSGALHTTADLSRITNDANNIRSQLGAILSTIASDECPLPVSSNPSSSGGGSVSKTLPSQRQTIQ